MEGLLRCGFRPRLDTTSFVEWDARRFNQLADDAANKALDEECGWQVRHEPGIQGVLGCPVNYRVCFDGAKRGSGKAAAGLAIIAYRGDGTRDLLLRAGRFLGQLSSSFAAETFALEWALEVFVSLGLAE